MLRCRLYCTALCFTEIERRTEMNQTMPCVILPNITPVYQLSLHFLAYIHHVSITPTLHVRFLNTPLSRFQSTFLVGYQRLEGSVIGAIYAFAMFQLLRCTESEARTRTHVHAHILLYTYLYLTLILFYSGLLES